MKRASSDDPGLGGEYPVIPPREDLEGVPVDGDCDCWLHRSTTRTLWAIALLCLGILSLACVMAMTACIGVGGR